MSKLSAVKQQVKKTLNGLGLEVHRFNPSASPRARLMAALRTFNIDMVIDIGANEGQFARELRAGGYTGSILSVEPMASAHERLTVHSRGDYAWQVHPRCAVGADIGEVELNIAGNSVSSSVLPMLASHINAAPESAYQGKEKVPLNTLDLIVPPYIEQTNALFLKIDTQGFEWPVLDGATATLPKVRGVLMELSLVPLYEGQHLWRECVDRLQAEGFVLWALEPAFIDPASGRTLQWDGLFFRP